MSTSVLWGIRVGGGGVVKWWVVGDDTVERQGRVACASNVDIVGLGDSPCCWIGWEDSPSSGGLGAHGRLRRPVRRRGRARRATAMWSLSTGGEDRDGDAVAFGSARRAAGLPLNGVLSTATLREGAKLNVRGPVVRGVVSDTLELRRLVRSLKRLFVDSMNLSILVEMDSSAAP